MIKMANYEKTLPKNLAKKILDTNGRKRGEIILDGLSILQSELKRFRFKPSKNNFTEGVYSKAHKEAMQKLSRVDYLPFAVVGLKGSTLLQQSHDIDIIFLPAKGITSGILLAAVSKFTDIFRKTYLLKTKRRVICFPFSTIQEEVEYLSKRKSEELLLHFSSTCEHFYGKNIQNPKGIKTWMPDFILYKSKYPIITDIPETKLDRMYLGLNMFDIFGTDYPKKLLNAKIHLLDYIAKIIGIKKAQNTVNPLIYYQQICLITDYLNKLK